MNYIQYMLKPALLILKLDDEANTAAYNEALLYFESLGFRGKTASDLAIEKVHNNVLFDAGSLPEVEVVAKAWGDGDDASRRENYQKARKAEREAEEKAQQHEMNQSIRNATDKWGNAIGAGIEIASGFTPLWWVSPAVRTGLDLSEGDYKGAALNAGLAFAAPYAVGKAFQHGDDLYRGYKSMTDPKNVYETMAEVMSPIMTSNKGTIFGRSISKISSTERLGIPKGDRNQALAIKLLVDTNTKKIIDFLNSNRGTVYGHNIYEGSKLVRDLRAFLLQNKVDISKLSNQDLADLVALRQQALRTQAPSRYIVPGESHVQLYAPGVKEYIGYADFGPLDDMYTIDMISSTTFVPGRVPEKGVSEDIMNFLIQRSIKNGGKGVRSGHLLRSPWATTKIWNKYPDKEILSMTEGNHYWDPYTATSGPIVLLKSPSKLVVPSKSFLFSPNSITNDGRMIIDWNKGLYRKNGGKLNYLNLMK